MRAAALALLFTVSAMSDPASGQGTMSSRDLLALPQPPADETIAYGPGPQQVCGDAIPRLLGGAPAAVPDRVAAVSPIRLAPPPVPVRLVCGGRDRLVPIGQAQDYEAAARARGGDASLVVVESAGHFELVDPASAAWPAVRDAVASLLRGAGRTR